MDYKISHTTVYTYTEGVPFCHNEVHLTPRDQLKFVICSRDDYDWSKAFLQEHHLGERCRILFSPSYNQLSPTLLAEWILADRLPVRFQMQLHKILWGDVPGK